MVVPGLVSPALKRMCWCPSSGLTPPTVPFWKLTGPPVPPTVQPVIPVEPAGKTCPSPAANAGNSKLPLVKGPGGGELAATETLSSSKSTATVADEVSVNVKVELLVVAVNVNVCAEP